MNLVVGVFLLLRFVAVALVFYSAFHLLPKGPANSEVSFLRSNLIISLVPQGWAFFTRDPQEKVTRVYKKNELGDWQVVTGYSNSFSNFFGWDRSQRVLFEEASLYWKMLFEMQKAECSGSLSDCSKKLDLVEPVQLPLSFQRPNFCGELLLTNAPPLPFEWIRLKSKLSIRYQAAIVRINCS